MKGRGTGDTEDAGRRSLYERVGVRLSSALELVAQKSEGRGPGQPLEMQLQQTTVVCYDAWVDET